MSENGAGHLDDILSDKQARFRSIKKQKNHANEQYIFMGMTLVYGL